MTRRPTEAAGFAAGEQKRVGTPFAANGSLERRKKGGHPLRVLQSAGANGFEPSKSGAPNHFYPTSAGLGHPPTKPSASDFAACCR